MAAHGQFSRDARADASIDAAQEMLAWMQESGAVVQELLPLMGDDLLGSLLAPLSTEVIDPDALNMALDNYANARVGILSRTQARIDDLPAPEKWNFDRSLFSSQERGIYKATTQQYADLQDTYDAFESISGDMILGLRKLANDEEVDFQTILGRVSETSIRVLLSENQVLEAFTASMPATSPNKNFHQVMLALNKATLVDMKLLGAYNPDVDPISVRQSYGRRMMMTLRDVPSLIESGRNKIQVQTKFYQDNLSSDKLTDKERKLLMALSPAIRTFEQSFDIEQRLYENDLRAATLYASDKSDAEIDPEIEANTLVSARLLEERMSTMMSRMSAMQ